MTHLLAFANQKGGTGKTTSVINLSGALSELGKNVLVVDADPQGSLSLGFGVDVSGLERTLYDVLVDGVPITQILQRVREHIDLAPTNIYLSVVDLKLAGEIRREDRLKQALAPVKKRYDFVLIDCPPSLGLLTINALAAAGEVLIPMSCDFYSLMGVRLLLETIRKIQSHLNPDLKILGVLPTRYDARTIHARDVLNDAREKLGGHIKVFDTVIRESVRLKEAPVSGLTIIEYSSDHSSAQDYRNFAKEFLHAYE